jgi:hypothetical protein
LARWEPDKVDFMCDSWAYQWVSLFARDPRKASETVGRLASTLGLVRVMGDGAGSTGTIAQVYPEVFLGDGLLVACLIKTMTERQREWLFVHYVYRWFGLRDVDVNGKTMTEIVRRGRPIKQAIAAEDMQISLARYLEIREIVKRRIRVTIDPLVSKLSA